VLWDFRPLPLNYGVLLEGQTFPEIWLLPHIDLLPSTFKDACHIQGMVAALSLGTKLACTTALTKMFNSVGEMQNEFSKDGT